MKPNVGLLRNNYREKREAMPKREFDALYEAYTKTVYWAAYGVSRDTYAAEEAVQNVFMRAYLHMDTLDGMSDEQVRSWLYRSATNSAIDGLRRNKRLISVEDAGVNEVDGAVGPETSALLSEEQRVIRDAVDKLPEKYRVPITLYYFAEMEYKAMAKMLDMSEGTLKSRMARGRDMLKKELGKGSAYYEA